MIVAQRGKLTTAQLNLLNLLMFQAVWWLSILYQNSVLVISLGLLLIHFALSSNRQADLLCMLKVVACGLVIDSTLTLMNVFQFQTTPYWLALIWCHFALSLRYSLAFAQKLPFYLNAILGGVFGCMSYLAGERFDAVQLPMDYLGSAMILLSIWFVIFPIFVNVSKPESVSQR